MTLMMQDMIGTQADKVDNREYTALQENRHFSKACELISSSISN